jgi:hypothetical protein
VITGINPRKNISESSAGNTTAVKTQRAANVSKSPVSSAVNTPRSAASLSAALGLPHDKLSASIISFARFFSLPLKPQLLADIRRQAFTPPAQAGNQSTAAKAVAAEVTAVKNTLAETTAAKVMAAKTAEAENAAKTFTAKAVFTNTAEDTSASLTAAKTRQAFAAAAAESKGIELQPKGLESYADAVDPDSRRQDGGHRRRNREQNKQTEKVSSKNGSIKKSRYSEISSPQFFTADNLKKMSFENPEQNPLLDILNRLPCKNGQRWVVYPFDFVEGGKEYLVSIRILLDDERSLNRAVCMALDIVESDYIESTAENNIIEPAAENSNIESTAEGNRKQNFSSGDSNPARRWLFVTESANKKPMRLFMYLKPELPLKSHTRFKRELSKLLNIPFERIFIKSGEDHFPYEASFAENFPLIDEAV